MGNINKPVSSEGGTKPSDVSRPQKGTGAAAGGGGRAFLVAEAAVV